MGKYTEFAEVGKEVGGGGVRRFAILLLFLLIGLILIYGMVTTPTAAPVPDVTTPTAVPTTAAGVAVNVEQAAPAVSVNVEQSQPLTQQDNTVALMAYQEAASAMNKAEGAHQLATALYPRVDDLERAVDALASAPDISPTLVAFDSRAASLESQLGTITAVTIGSLVGLLLMAVAGGLLLFRTPPPPRLTIDQMPEQLSTTPPHRLTPAVIRPRSSPEVNRRSEPFRTVPNWLELPLDSNVQPEPAIRDLWRTLHANGMSKTAICEAFYGSKGAAYRWVKAAFDEATIIEG